MNSWPPRVAAVWPLRLAEQARPAGRIGDNIGSVGAERPVGEGTERVAAPLKPNPWLSGGGGLGEDFAGPPNIG